MPLGRLKLGGDPRRSLEFAQLRQALRPLTHPACPDMDWQQVRACAHALMQAHGADLLGLRALALAHLWCAEPQAAAAVVRCAAQLLVEHSASLWPAEASQRQLLVDQWCQWLLAWSRQAAPEEVWELSPALMTLRQALEAAWLVPPPALCALLARSERRCVPIDLPPLSDRPMPSRVAGPGTAPAQTPAKGPLRTYAGVGVLCLVSLFGWQPTRLSEPLHIADLALFGAGSAQLDTQAQRSLAGVLETVAEHPGWVIEVRGHSDDSGSPQRNLDLAEARAAAVGAWFAAQGVAARCLQASGMGASQPLLDNATAAGRAANRRVSISVMAATPPCQLTEPATTAAPPSPATAPPPPHPSVPAPLRQ